MTARRMLQQNAIPTKGATIMQSSLPGLPAPLPVETDYAACTPAQLAQAFRAEAYQEQLPPKTADAADYCNILFRLTNIFGPQDLGNGPVFGVETADADGLLNVFWIGWQRAIPVLGAPALRAWLQRGYEATVTWTHVEGKTNAYYLLAVELVLPEAAS